MPGVFVDIMATAQKRQGSGAEQALSLLTKPLSKDLPARHITAIRHLCNDFERGCTLASLSTVSKILRIVVHNVAADPGGPFAEVACELLRWVRCVCACRGSRQHIKLHILISTCRVLSQPFVRLHTSDNLSLAGNISELFQVVQLCLRPEMPEMVACSAAAVMLTDCSILLRVLLICPYVDLFTYATT